MNELSVFSSDDFKGLTRNQKLPFYQIMKGKSVLIVGGGGVGKSHLTCQVARHVPGLVILGSTGTAAVNVGGQTVDSFFGFGRHFLTPAEGAKMHHATLATLKRVKSILIDEFGALRRDKLQLIDIRLRAAKGNELPFGGVQVIGVGDFCQIKPVLPRDKPEAKLFYQHYGKRDVYPFLAPDFDKYNLTPYLLSEYVRQTDPYEQHILKHIRLGLDVKEAVKRINAIVRKAPDYDTIVLCGLKSVAERYNKAKYERLNQTEFSYESEQEGEVEYPPAPATVRLKQGARVVITINNPSENYYNGDLGTVLSMDNDGVEVELDRGPVVFVEKYTWDFLQQETFDNGDVSRRRVGGYTQLPIMLAYGITIHRSQGMTLPSAHIDLTGGFFSEGMCYVALSRTKTLRNLSLSRPLYHKDVFYSQVAIDVTKKLSHLALSRFEREESDMLRHISAA